MTGPSACVSIGVDGGARAGRFVQIGGIGAHEFATRYNDFNVSHCRPRISDILDQAVWSEWKVLSPCTSPA